MSETNKSASPGKEPESPPKDAGSPAGAGNTDYLCDTEHWSSYPSYVGRSRRRPVKVSVETYNLAHKIKLPRYSFPEELMNAVSHGVGWLLSIAALVLCVIRAAMYSDAWAVVSGAVYGASLIILYTMSTMYHSLGVNEAKSVFRVMDHCSIFILIAGTYTPYTLVSLRRYNPALGWTLFGVIWAASAVGITLTAVDMFRFNRLAQATYIASGWAIVAAMHPLTRCVARPGIVLLIAGGVLYTVGAVFYAIGAKHRYMHAVFHMFVLAGSILHFFSIFWYVM